MNCSILLQLKRRSSYRKVKSLMRGYQYLQKAHSLGRVRKLKNDLIDYLFIEIPQNNSKFTFGVNSKNVELVTRQFLLQRHAGTGLIKAILHSIGNKNTSIIYPLPSAWQEGLLQCGFRVNKLLSTFLWCGFIFLYWGYGISWILRILLNSFVKVFFYQPRMLGRYVYFEGLTSNNLPQPDSDGCSYDICTWYSTWNGRAERIDMLCHGVHGAEKKQIKNLKIESIGLPLQPLESFSKFTTFLGWSFGAIVYSAFCAICGRWWSALLLSECAKAKVVQLTHPQALAVEYLFHYSGTIYRPMWTYEAEKKGAKIICYFYSTSEQVKLPNGYQSQRYEWGAASWPNYLVWDDYQASLLRRDIDNCGTIKVVGPIWFSTSSKELPEIPDKSIAVFDVQPHRKSLHFGFSTLCDYITDNPNMQIQFLEDIHQVLSEYAGIMVLKRKREIGKREVKRYRNLIRRLVMSGNVLEVDPNISAIKVIKECNGVISMPFTSTALYLRDQGVASVYYDPTGWIQKDDRGAHGIEILSGKQELQVWVKHLFGNE